MRYSIFFSGISPILTEHLAEFDFVLTEISPTLTGISVFGEVSQDSWPNVKSVMQLVAFPSHPSPVPITSSSPFLMDTFTSNYYPADITPNTSMSIAEPSQDFVLGQFTIFLTISVNPCLGA